MKIKMRTLAAGPAGVFHPGVEYTVPDAVGQPMVDGQYAELIARTAVAEVKAPREREPTVPAKPGPKRTVRRG